MAARLRGQRGGTALLQAGLLLALLSLLTSGTCHAKLCSGDGCDDPPEDPEPESIVVIPRLDALARPLARPALLLVGRDRAGAFRRP